MGDVGSWRLVPTRANRMPTAASYFRGEDGVHRAFKLDVLRVEDGAIVEITTFGPDLFPQFGLPGDAAGGVAEDGRRTGHSSVPPLDNWPGPRTGHSPGRRWTIGRVARTGHSAVPPSDNRPGRYAWPAGRRAARGVVAVLAAAAVVAAFGDLLDEPWRRTRRGRRACGWSRGRRRPRPRGRPTGRRRCGGRCARSGTTSSCGRGRRRPRPAATARGRWRRPACRRRRTRARRRPPSSSVRSWSGLATPPGSTRASKSSARTSPTAWSATNVLPLSRWLKPWNGPAFRETSVVSAPASADGLERSFELDLLHAVGRQERDALALEVVHGGLLAEVAGGTVPDRAGETCAPPSPARGRAVTAPRRTRRCSTARTSRACSGAA